MNNKPSRNFDQIKPFLRMLEGSIDDARKRRLGHEAAPTHPPAPASRNGSPAPLPARNDSPIPMPPSSNGTGQPAPAPAPEADRPLRATPIKPKQSIQTGFRPTGS